MEQGPSEPVTVCQERLAILDDADRLPSQHRLSQATKRFHK
jgi:hypothetical protein